LIIEVKIEKKRGIGRKKMSWLRNVRLWTGLRTKHAAEEKEYENT